MSDCGYDGEHCRIEDLEALEARYDAVVTAFKAMVRVDRDGKPFYVKGPQHAIDMPKRVEQKVRVALTALSEAAGRGPA